MINDRVVALHRRKTTQNPFAANGGWAQKLGIPDVNGVNFPYFVGPSGGQFYRMSTGGTSSEVWEAVRARENLTKVWGKHTVKGGYEILRTRYNVLAEALPSGKYFMSGTELPFATAGTTANDFADLLLGYVDQAQFSQALAAWLPRWWTHAAYIQDEWRPMRNMTIIYALRLSYYSRHTSNTHQHTT